MNLAIRLQFEPSPVSEFSLRVRDPSFQPPMLRRGFSLNKMFQLILKPYLASPLPVVCFFLVGCV
nr:hypothetical protein Q903MT_gene5275 [Picea sitchensis]